MSKDYKPAPARQKPAGKGSPFFAGLLVGLLLGIGASVAVAIYIKQGENPFQAKNSQAPEIATANPNQKSPASAETPASAGNPAATEPAKKEDRFTFYGILTGSEAPVSEQEVKQHADQAKTTPEANTKPAAESYYLQVGAFQTEQEADNSKAKLALIGLEAVVQTANIPDQGTWHRVRVGPLATIDEINKARSELARNGFKADLIKIRNNVPDQ